MASSIAEMLYDFDAHLARFGVASIDLTTTREARFVKKQQLCYQAMCHWIVETPDAAFERFYRAFDRLAERPYIWRVWILQELFCAQQIRIFCGFDGYELSTLLLWWRQAKFLLVPAYNGNEDAVRDGDSTILKKTWSVLPSRGALDGH